MQEYPRVLAACDLFLFGGECNDPTYFDELATSSKRARPVASGAGLTRTEALWAALGESIERYIPLINPTSYRSLVRGSYTELSDRAVDPRSFLFYRDEQYQTPGFMFRRFDPEKVRRWAEATELGTGLVRLVTAQLVWSGLTCEGPDEILAQSTTSGLACGQSPQHAQLSGILEVIERDAFMATWLLRRPPVRLVMDDAVIEQLDPRLRSLLRPNKLQVTVLEISTDIPVPVILVVLRPADRSRLVVGAAAYPDRRVAIRKAVVEAHHGWGWVQTMLPEPLPAPDEIDTFEQHVRYYTVPQNQYMAEFLDQGPEAVPSFEEHPTERAELLDALIKTLSERGRSTYFVDLTTPDVAQLGLTLGRSLVTGLHPLACGPRHYPLDDRRLREVAAAWGIDMPPHLNSDPHPFP
jgi:ribosomal protein S12 methylthiotransferase accessory factor